MNINIWFIYFFVVILIIWFIITPTTEKFTPIRAFLHANMDENNNAINYSYQSPHMNGIQGCAIVPCPENYNEKIICWKCCNYF